MKQLYLLRHAKTNQSSATGKDFDRELLPKGVQQLQELRLFFSRYNFKKPIDIWVSSAMRTQQTFEGINHAFALQSATSSIDIYNDLYLATAAELLQKIWQHPSENDLFIIGHNNGISDLASYYTEENVDLRTAALMQLSFDCDQWMETSKGMATIVDQFHPAC